MVPSSFSTRLHAEIHSFWKEKSSPTPRLSSHDPLSIGALFPDLQVKPPFERLQGGVGKYHVD
jgi:hypothetical protein